MSVLTKTFDTVDVYLLFITYSAVKISSMK